MGDLSTLFEFERAALASGIPAAINRGAYYFTNLDMLVEPAKAGAVPTPFLTDFLLPMVAPADLGAAAADRLQSPVDDVGIAHVEGPKRHTFADVAAAFARMTAATVDGPDLPGKPRRGRIALDNYVAGLMAEPT